MTDTPRTRRSRVLFLPPLQPEKQAYALARYSRSPDPIEESLAWVETHSEQRFWESFYFDYGHASIADLGHVAACFEELSELAAIEVLDEQVWDGQARSTRYQDFAQIPPVVPPEIAGTPLERDFVAFVQSLVSRYRDVHGRCIAWLSERHPRPEDMKPATYDRNVAARAFDMARSLLPLAIPTSVGQVTSIRTVEKQISRLLVSELAEVRALAERLVEACGAPVSGGGAPPAPTLARHAKPSTHARACRERAARVAREAFGGSVPANESAARLQAPCAPAVEMLATLVYEHARLPWADIVSRAAGLSPAERSAMLSAILAERGPHDELPRAARAGHAVVFEISMDIGGWRDMHRHRRCQQHLQAIDLDAGAEMPPDADAAGIADDCRRAHEEAVSFARLLGRSTSPVVAAYALPFMHRVRSVFKMDFAEADYIARLRSGVKGHPSYRRIAFDMYRELAEAHPELAMLLDATSPDVQDPLTR